MSLSQDMLEAETGSVLPSRDTLSRFTFTNQFAFVWAPSTAIVVINHGNFNNATAIAGASVSIVQTAG
jgi:hypothetical protein